MNKGVNVIEKSHSTFGAQRPAILVAGVIASALLLSACSGGGQEPAADAPSAETSPGGVLSEAAWEDLVDAATAEGEVVVYSSLSDTEETFARFEDAYPGISVRLERTPTADLIARLDQELAVNVQGADVTMHSLPGWFAERDADGSFAALQVSPENESAGWVEHINGRKYAETLATPLLLGVNTNAAESYFSAEDILDVPKDSKIGIIWPQITSAQALQYQLWLDDFGDDFLEQISQFENLKVYESNVPMAQDLAAGALDYTLGMTPSPVVTLEAEGAPVHVEIPTEGGVSGVYYNQAVLANAPHPNAAQLFANWLASENGAEVIVERHAPVAVPLDSPGSVPWDSMTRLDVTEWTNEYWDEWIADEWTPYFG